MNILRPLPRNPDGSLKPQEPKVDRKKTSDKEVDGFSVELAGFMQQELIETRRQLEAERDKNATLLLENKRLEEKIRELEAKTLFFLHG